MDPFGNQGMSSTAQTWIDRLCPDVVDKIVLCLTGGKQNEEASYLAMISPQLRDRVLSVLEYKLELTAEPTQDELWLQHFGTRAEKITFPSELLRTNSALLSALQSPSCKSLDLVLTSDALLGYDSSVIEVVKEKELTLSFSLFPLFDADDVLMFLLWFQPHFLYLTGDDEYMVQFFETLLPQFSTYAAAFQRLKKISFWGPLCRRAKTFWWRFISLVPHMSEIRVVGEVEKDHIPVLKSRSSILAHNLTDGISEVIDIGNTVKELTLYSHCRNSVLSTSQLQELDTIFPSLRTLAIDLKEGTEYALRKSLVKMHFLQELKLSWHCSDAEMEVPGRMVFPYANAPRGTILSLAKACPKLTALYLNCINIACNELQDIIRDIGVNLTEFSFSFPKASYASMEKIIMSMIALMKYSPNIVIFNPHQRNLVSVQGLIPLDEEIEDAANGSEKSWVILCMHMIHVAKRFEQYSVRLNKDHFHPIMMWVAEKVLSMVRKEVEENVVGPEGNLESSQYGASANNANDAANLNRGNDSVISVMIGGWERYFRETA